MAANNYDVRMYYTEDDLKKVQTKTNLYIQKYGDMGIYHLFKEAAQNGIDEYIDPACISFLKALGESIKKLVLHITHDRITDRVTIEDNGRGIPEEDYPIDIVCTKLQSGSKFYRDQGGKSSGEFGVGITVVNALSTEFTLTTYRSTYYHKIGFKNGEKILDETGDIKKNGKKHGTIISFIANPLYLGAGARLPLETCIDWLDMMSYLVDENIQFVVDEYNGVELLRSRTIMRKPFSELIYKFIPDDSGIAFGPASFTGHGSITEEITKNVIAANGKAKEKKEKRKKDIQLDFAFVYDTTILEFDYDAFCNFTKTDEGGVHVDAVEDVLCKYLQTKAMNSMTDLQKENYPVTRTDTRSGLKLVVNLSTTAQVQFMGNAKNKIQNEALRPVLKEIAYRVIDTYFTENPGKLADAIKFVRTNAKNRIDLQKMRSVAVKGKNTRFDDLQIGNFIPANNNKLNDYRELFLIEGRKSAAGAMVNARDPNTQAIFAFRGQTLNPFKTTFTKFMENEEWRQYIKVLRCGIRSSFDIKKLYYNKIIIETDADIDGYGIGIGIAGTHVLYLPEIVTGGFLYKGYPPLYRIDDAKRPFIGNKGELVEIYMKEVVKRYKLIIGNHEFTKDEFWGFLYDIVDYRFILSEMLQPFYKIPVELIEVIAAALVMCKGVDTRGDEPRLQIGIFENQSFVRDFMQLIQKMFPEINLKGSTIQGVANGLTVSIRINDRFATKIEQLIPVYSKYGYIIGVKDKVSTELMTILQFCNITHSLTPKILTRFKGLGECNADQLWETTLNPANRILVQLTMDNIERDMEIFRKLKSDRPIYMKQRAEMVEAYKIRYEDLDN